MEPKNSLISYTVMVIELQSFFTLLIGCLAFYGIGWIVYARVFHPLADIPGPFFASISRGWIASQVLSGKAEYTQRALHKRHGPLIRIAPNEVSVSDPAAVKVIYNIKSGFTKTDFYPPFAPNISKLGDHFAQLDEKKHADHRRLVNNVYSMSSILESEKYIDSCIDVFVEKMSRYANSVQTMDFGEWLQWYTFDVVGELFFGHQFGFMKDEHDYKGYIQCLDNLLPGISLACVLPSYVRPINASLGMLSPTIRASFVGFNDIRAAGRYWTARRQEQIEAGKATRVDLLNKFFRIRDEKEIFDIPEIENEATVAIFAGSDTTAIALRAVFYYLMKTPSAMQKLVSEVDSAYKRRDTAASHLTYNETIKMPYLVACCKEGMRLHPSVGLGMPRNVPTEGAVIAGRTFKPGTRVSMNASVIQYDKTIFGDDADRFNPDRWLERDAAEMDRHMLHFGGGSRTCIGKNIALAEIHKLVPEILHKFELRLCDPSSEWETHNFWFNKQVNINVKAVLRHH